MNYTGSMPVCFFIYQINKFRKTFIVSFVCQGGVGIKRSLDVLAATALTYEYAEPPRLVSFDILWKINLCYFG